MLAEGLWYQLPTGIGFRRPFMANFDLAALRYRIAPGWWVLCAGLAVTAVAEFRHRTSGAPRRGRATAAA